MTVQPFTSREQWGRYERQMQSIGVKRVYVKMAGGWIAGVILARLVYWESPPRDESKPRRGGIFRDGKWWVVRQRSVWQEELYMTEGEFDTGLKTLREKGLVEVQTHFFNRKRALWLRTVEPTFLQAVNAALEAAPLKPPRPRRPRQSKSLNNDFKNSSYSPGITLQQEGADAPPCEEQEQIQPTEDPSPASSGIAPTEEVTWDDIQAAPVEARMGGDFLPGSKLDLLEALKVVCFDMVNDPEAWIVSKTKLMRVVKEIQEINTQLSEPITGEEIREKFGWPEGMWYRTWKAKDEQGGFTRRPTIFNVRDEIRNLKAYLVDQEGTPRAAYQGQRGQPLPGGNWQPALLPDEPPPPPRLLSETEKEARVLRALAIKDQARRGAA